MAEIPAGWPCAALPALAPSVADRQSAPTADDLLPQVLALTPRGPAWGTDEAGDGRGASPVLQLFWRAVAAWVADENGREFDLATQALPSAVTWSLGDWEREYGLPDPCRSGQGGQAARLAAVRARFMALGGQSPAYFVCLAASLGYDITIEEPSQFFVDESEVIGGDPVETWFEASDVAGEGGALSAGDIVELWGTCDDLECDGDPVEAFVLPALGDGDPLEALVLAPAPDGVGDEVAGGLLETWGICDEVECDGEPLEGFTDDPVGTVWKYWVVHVASLGETWFRVDEGECDGDPVEGFLPATDLECLIRALAPPHTQVVFSYALNDNAGALAAA